MCVRVSTHDCSQLLYAREGVSYLWPGMVRKVHDDRCRGAPHNHPLERLGLRRIEFHVQQEGGDMDEVARLRARNALALRPPPNFADARQNICDRLLLAMMMDAGACLWPDLKKAAPQGRVDTELRRDGSQAQGAGSLCRSGMEFGRAEDLDGGGRPCHDVGSCWAAQV